jgi:hypothetical protein
MTNCFGQRFGERKVKRSGETAGTEPERNVRRRAADGSKRDCVFILRPRRARVERSGTRVGRGGFPLGIEIEFCDDFITTFISGFR